VLPNTLLFDIIDAWCNHEDKCVAISKGTGMLYHHVPTTEKHG